jgi:FtsP/CotA-like multicopper oxidase with cupredoxin domain
MRFPQRLGSFAFLAMLAAGIFTSTALQPHSRAIGVAVAATPPACTPNLSTYHGMLPQPPLIDVRQNQAIVMNVLMGPTPVPGSGATQSYCYVLEGSSAQFVDAPTLRVRQGETFTLKLNDKIPASASPMPSVAPEAQMTAGDGCALLPYEPALPPPGAKPAYLDHPRVYATMPAMIESDTNFHTHGWHVSPDVDNVFKSLARSTEDACTYTFVIPLTQPAGSYWYHAHLHGLAGQQVGGGLAGALVVLPAARPTSIPLPERVILIKNSTYAVDQAPTNRDVEAKLALAGRTLKATHAASPAPPPSFDPFNPPPWPSGWAFKQNASRCDVNPATSFISHWVVNGYPVADPKLTPSVSTPAIALLRPGARELYRIVDGMSDSYANIEMLDANGNREDLDVVGRDGVPINTNQTNEDLSVPFKNVLLPPGGRVDIVVSGTAAQQTLIADKVCTGYLGEYIPVRKLVLVKPWLTQTRAETLSHPVLRTSVTSASALYNLGENEITRRRAITFTQYQESSNAAWYVTDTSSNPNGFIEHPFWLTQDPANPDPGHYLPEISVPQNSVEEWSLINASGEIHAFHIHQLTFVTLSNPEFEGPHLPVYQDTVALPAALVRPVAGDPTYPILIPSKTIIRIDFRHVNKGTFVFHCHMLFHEDRGMMAIIRVY